MSYKIPKHVMDALDQLPKDEYRPRLKEIERVANAPRSMSTFPEWSVSIQHNYLLCIAQKKIDIGS